MSMTREEKIISRRQLRRSVIIKMIGKRIGYHYLSKRLQALWNMQSTTMLIELPNGFYIVKFTNEQDYFKALLDGWTFGDHYLHVQCWTPNFIAETSKIDLLPIWVCFPILPVEYYISSWLQRAGNKIERTLKVDNTTLMISRGKFAKVCMEVDLNKPLKAGYKLKGRL